MAVEGKAVLVHIDGSRWRVDNTELNARTEGLDYRQSKRFDDKLVHPLAKWGSIVDGIDTGDGWLQTQVRSRRCW